MSTQPVRRLNTTAIIAIVLAVWSPILVVLAINLHHRFFVVGPILEENKAVMQAFFDKEMPVPVKVLTAHSQLLDSCEVFCILPEVKDKAEIYFVTNSRDNFVKGDESIFFIHKDVGKLVMNKLLHECPASDTSCYPVPESKFFARRVDYTSIVADLDEDTIHECYDRGLRGNTYVVCVRKIVNKYAVFSETFTILVTPPYLNISPISGSTGLTYLPNVVIIRDHENGRREAVRGFTPAE